MATTARDLGLPLRGTRRRRLSARRPEPVVALGLTSSIVGVACFGAVLFGGTSASPGGALERTAGAAVATAQSIPGRPGAGSWTTDGSEPTARPTDDFGVGPFAYGDPLHVVTDSLGAPARQWTEDQELVLGSTLVSVWRFDGAVLRIEALPETPHLVELVELTIEPSSPLRMALARHLVAGRSTMADAIAAHGDDHWFDVVPAAAGSGADAVDEYVHSVSFPACDGPYPMVVTFGRRIAAPPGSTYDDAVPAFDRRILHDPFTDVRMTWADGAPGTAPCGTVAAQEVIGSE